jgi:hypothetical protein
MESLSRRNHLEGLPAEMLLDIIDLLQKPTAELSAMEPSRGAVDFSAVFRSVE